MADFPTGWCNQVGSVIFPFLCCYNCNCHHCPCHWGSTIALAHALCFNLVIFILFWASRIVCGVPIANVSDCDRPICNPFSSNIFTVFNVSVSFTCQVVALQDTWIVVIENRHGSSCIGNGVSPGGEVKYEVLSVYCQTRTHVGNSYLCFAWAEWCPLLAVNFPSDMATRSEQYCTTHRPKFEQRELDSSVDCINNLWTLACIAIHIQMVVVLKRKMNSVHTCFCVWPMRKGHVDVQGYRHFGREGWIHSWSQSGCNGGCRVRN